MVQELRGLAQEMQATDRKFAHFCRAGVKVAEYATQINVPFHHLAPTRVPVNKYTQTVVLRDK